MTERTCEHASCSCLLEFEEEFCCDYCRIKERSRHDLDDTCVCGHDACSTNVVEREASSDSD